MSDTPQTEGSAESAAARFRSELAAATQPQEPEVTPVDGWYDVFEKPVKRTLPSGRTALVRHLDIVSELLAGTLPNRVLDQVMFGKDLRSINPDNDEKAKQVTAYVEGLLNIAVRALVQPKLVLDRKPERAKGEVGPGVFSLQDLQEIRFIAIYERLMEVSEPGFPETPANEGGGTGTPALPE